VLVTATMPTDRYSISIKRYVPSRHLYQHLLTTFFHRVDLSHSAPTVELCASRAPLTSVVNVAATKHTTRELAHMKWILKVSMLWDV
jgi:hypothetical protein